MATMTFPKFEIKDFSDANLRNPDLVKGKLSEAMTAVNLRDKEIDRLAQNNEELDRKFTEANRTIAVSNTELQSVRKELATEVSRGQELRVGLDKEIERLLQNNQELEKKFTEASRTIAVNNTELQSVRKELATEATRAQELRERLDKIDLNPPKISVQDLVSQFKGNIDRINAEVVSRKTEGMLVDSVEVEVRGGIDVSNGLHISQLPPSALVASSASVLRFNLRPSSPLKIVEDDELG